MTGFAAGWVDSIAGGGGLITVPVLLSLGLPPKDALGTNKLQASFGSGSAAFHYARAGTVNLRDCVGGFLYTFAGAAIGALLVQRRDASLLEKMIPVLLIAVAIFTLLKPALGEMDAHPRMRRGYFDLIFGLGIGFYDGFFGPGTGTFWTMAFMLGIGFNMAKATGYTKVMNFSSNLSSLIFFILGGRVLWVEGLVMGMGQLLGARLGARMVIARGTRFVRPIFLTIVFALTFKLLYSTYAK
jgi:uncharacterized membrane protein YfcA